MLSNCSHRWVRDQTYHVATDTVTDTVACRECGEPPPGPRLKIYALIPSERIKVCDHPSGFAYTGKVPCTGPRLCYLCGTNERDALSLKESATPAVLES